MKQRRDLEDDVKMIQKHAGWLLNGHTPVTKNDVTVVHVAELMRRDAESSLLDGYPSTAMGVGTHGGDVSRPTERVGVDLADAEVMQRAEDADHLHRAVFGIEEHLERAREHMRQAISLSYLVYRLQTHRKANPPTRCMGCTKVVACTTTDPIRSGFCNACRMAWTRYSDQERSEGREPDRVAFIKTRRPEDEESAA